MNYDQIIEEILNYAKTQKDKKNLPDYSVNVDSLMNHFKRKYPDLDHRPIEDTIEEIDARGWLLENTSSVLVFDPATFS
jgi:hypothetical protein